MTSVHLSAPQSLAEGKPAALRFDIVRSRADFDALEAPWNALFERAGRPDQVFQTFNWLWHWAEHFLSGEVRLSIVTAWKGERLVMAWPLVCRRVAGLTRVSWMGEPVSQYGDVLAEDGPDTDSLLQQGWALVAALGADLVSLRKVRDDSVVAPVLAAHESVRTERHEAPFLDFAGAKNFVAYERRYAGKKRSARRRRLRRLQETCAVSFEQYHAGAAALLHVEQALAWKKAWLSARGLFSPALRDPRLDRFFKSVATATARPVSTRVSVVACDRTSAAIEISFVCKGAVFGHVLAYDDGFAKYGIGGLLAAHSIGTAVEAGFARFDLLAPSDPYKMDWADGTVGVNDHAIALSWAGSIYIQAWIGFARPRLKRILTLTAELRRTIRLRSRSPALGMRHRDEDDTAS